MENNCLNIILVEDNPDDVRFIRELLKENKEIKISHVNQLSKALDLIKKKKYDLILLDLNLPDSKGINTFKEFSSKTNGIPIIIITVNAEKEIADKAIKLGAQDYKIKGSFDYTSLHNSIKYAIERKKLLVESKVSATIFNNSLLGLAIVNPEHDILDANHALCKIMGYSLDEVKKLTFRDFTHPEDLKDSLKMVKELASGKINSFILEKRYLKKNGKVVYGRVNISSVKDNEGKIIYNVVSLEDITKSKENSEKIIKNHNEMLALFDSIDDVIYVTDMDSYEIIYVNKYTKKLLGKELIGGICYKEFQGFDRPCEFCTNKLIKSLKGKSYRWQHYNKNLNIHYDLIDRVIDWPDGRKVRFELARDITGIKKAQEETIASKKMLESTISSMKDLVFVFDTSKRFTYYHAPKGYDLYAKPDFFIGKKISEVLPKNVVSLFNKAFSKNKKGIPSDYEYSLEKKGKINYFYAKLSPIFIGKKFHGSVSVIRDITSKFLINKKLEESEKKYKNFIDNTDDLVQSISPQGKIVYANKSWHNKMGYSKKDLTKLHFKDIISPKCREYCMDLFKKVMQGKQAKNINAIFLTKSNKEIDVIGNAFPRIIDGKIIETQGIFNDITDLKKHEEKIKESEEKFKQLFINSQFGIALHEIIFDNKKKPIDYKIIDVNPAYESILNLKKSDIIGKKASEIYKTKIPPYLGIYSKVALSGKNQRFETYYEPMDMHFSISVFCPKKGNFATIFEDITETIKSKKKIIESEETLSSFFDSAYDMLGIADINTATFTKINPNFEKVLGYSEKELLGKPFLEFVHPDDKKDTLDIINNKLKKNIKSYKFVNRYKCKNGEYKSLEWTSSPDAKKGITYAVARDITQKIEDEEKLIQSTKKYKNLVENINDILFSVDFEGKIQYISSNCKKYGFDAKKLIGNNFSKIIHPDDIKKVMGELVLTMKTGREFPTTFRVINPKGKIFWFEEFGKVLRDESGNIIGTQGVLRDITDKKKMHNELIESQKRFEEVAKQSEEVIWEVDINGLYTYLSDACKDIYGFTPNELVGKKHFYDLHPKEFRAESKKLFIDSMKKKEKLKDFENSIIKKDGNKIIVLSNAFPIIKNDKAEGYRGLDIDITERKENQERILSLKNNYESIFESSSDAIIIFNENGKISKLNKSFEKILGLKRKDFLGKRIDSIKLLDDLENEIGIMANAKSKKIFGASFNGIYFNALINQTDESKVFQLSLRNITKKKEIQKVKEFNDKILMKKMEEENMINLKNQLLMRVSHELRHPLVPIMGYASVMLEENPSDIQEKYLKKILQNSNYLKELINKVLEVISFETGEAKINPQGLSINEVINKSIYENETKASLKGLRIIKNLKKVGKIFIDEIKIKMVIDNIIENAIKFTDKGYVTISLDKTKSHAAITISDTGKGMKKEEIEKIFTYVPIEDYKNLNIGLGLGLILSKYIIKAHKGELIISSKQGKGTSIKILLPLKLSGD